MYNLHSSLAGRILWSLTALFGLWPLLRCLCLPLFRKSQNARQFLVKCGKWKAPPPLGLYPATGKSLVLLFFCLLAFNAMAHRKALLANTKSKSWNFRDRTWNVEENLILHELFHVVSRCPRYISCYIAESRLPLVQCILYLTIKLWSWINYTHISTGLCTVLFDYFCLYWCEINMKNE